MTNTSALAAGIVALFVAAAPRPTLAAPARWGTLPSFRIAAGAHVALENSHRVGAAFDAGAGLRLFQIGERGFFVHPEFSYSYVDNASSSHTLLVGAGGGYRVKTLGLSLSPRLALSSEGTVGSRIGIGVDLVGIAYAEIAHQYLPVSGSDSHSLHAVAGVDIGALVSILMAPLELVGSQ